MVLYIEPKNIDQLKDAMPASIHGKYNLKQMKEAAKSTTKYYDVKTVLNDDLFISFKIL